MMSSRWIDSQSDDYLMCRDTGIRHPWQPYTAEALNGGRGGYIERLKCSRCGAIKTRRLDRRGVPVKKGSSRAYPDGFLREGMGRMSKEENAQIRIAHIKRRLEAGTSVPNPDAPLRRTGQRKTRKTVAAATSKTSKTTSKTSKTTTSKPASKTKRTNKAA
jgi:hypothetical protein